jgi:3-deoxy-7-phosphoheptulonate synthase
MSTDATSWTPRSWELLPVAQAPDWPDHDRLISVQQRLAQQPPLVFAGEARHLTAQLADVSAGRAFLLQAGDCAESFDAHSADSIRDKLKVILQMAVVLTYAAGVPVVKVGRIAGQFAKPRSSTTETRDGVSLPAFRGHLINDEPFTAEDRRPDPERMMTAYHQSVATLNLLRAFTKGGFADLSRVHAWNQAFVESSDQGQHYAAVADDIERAVRFMRACGVDFQRESSLSGVDFFTSHEALVLAYEQALTRVDSTTGDWYDCSAHMLWIGDRTRQPDGAHVEFLRGVGNPLGVKVGPTARAADLLELCERLNPDNVPGRVTFISRMGRTLVADLLPPLVEAVRDAGQAVVWACDPMHGNTFLAANDLKTRRFEDILHEVKTFFEVHHRLGTWAGGLHVELTGDDVTECLGGGSPLQESDLDLNYTSMCDPRLNATQSLDLAFQVAEFLQAGVRHS